MRTIFEKLAVFGTSLFSVGLVKCNYTINPEDDSDRGLGGFYKWVKYEKAFKEAKLQNKPILMVIHKSSCPTCTLLKERFSKSVRILDLSKEFVMVNVENGVEALAKDAKYQPDGKYVPRILFFTSDGKLIQEACNLSSCGNPEFRYFHKSPPSIVQTMRFVIENREKFIRPE